MAAATAKWESVSLSLFLEVNDLEVEEELAIVATLAWAKGSWMGKWRKQICEVQTWKQARGLAGSVLCEARDLGITWQQWHTLMFEGLCMM